MTSQSKHIRGAPALSVVMPVHNALPYLDEAIESIIAQTFTDFEFVILDDGSTDGSGQRLRDWGHREPRIRLLTANRKLGPVGSSNLVARAAKAPFVARMDADDTSFPNRFAEQLKLLRSDDGIGVVASLADVIDASDRKLRGPEVWRLSRRSAFVPFPHGAMMYRRDLFEQLGGYRPECEYWEDQDLVTRIANAAKVVVIPRALYRVRQSQTSTRVGAQQHRIEESSTSCTVVWRGLSKAEATMTCCRQRAVPSSTRGSFFRTGQSCCGPAFDCGYGTASSRARSCRSTLRPSRRRYGLAGRRPAPRGSVSSCCCCFLRVISLHRA